MEMEEIESTFEERNFVCCKSMLDAVTELIVRADIAQETIMTIHNHDKDLGFNFVQK